jgi:hypothetical protein
VGEGWGSFRGVLERRGVELKELNTVAAVSIFLKSNSIST